MFVFEASFRNIILEDDNLGVINAIRDNKDGLGSAGAVVANIRRARNDSTSFFVSFVKRTDNTVAHTLTM